MYYRVRGRRPADDLTRKNNEFAGANIAYFDPEYSIRNGIGVNWYDHGTQVALYAVGQSLGIAPRATMVLMADDGTMDQDDDVSGDEIVLVRLLGMIKDIEAKQRQGKCVISISIVYVMDPAWPKDEWQAQFRKSPLPPPPSLSARVWFDADMQYGCFVISATSSSALWSALPETKPT